MTSESITIYLDSELKTQFKIVALQEKKTMKQILTEYIEKYGLNQGAHYSGILGNYPRKPWNKFITSENQSLCPEDALDLLNKLLIYDHAERITPKEAMLHPYFAELREKFAKEGNPSLLSDNK